ncbi:hypothetical protein L1D52_09680 [Vibrio brasiliensis]|uniref:hypothetical protein n=1 Tax=Vibrio brasiliensis TaxID=170652 RepID=UPI001EFE30BF|nr:hypothetical protein [Vibrio brasiliensis]MCG9782624.1 hypothetical protein [Vibrio brasiliensis]
MEQSKTPKVISLVVGYLRKNHCLLPDICLLTASVFLVWEFTFYMTGLHNLLSSFWGAVLSSNNWITILWTWYSLGVLVPLIWYVISKTWPFAKTYECLSFLWRSPVCTSILHFTVFTIGIYFSINSSPVHEWLTNNEPLTVRFGISLAITVLVITIFVFILNQLSLVKDYDKKIDKLQDLIRLAPPNGFARTLAEYVDVAEDFVHYVAKSRSDIAEVIEYVKDQAPSKIGFTFSRKKGVAGISSQINPKKVEEEESKIREHLESLNKHVIDNGKYIRALLAAYARLAALFDGIEPSKSNQNIYRANLMLKYSSLDKKVPSYDSFRYVPAVLTEQNGEKIQLKANSISNYLSLHRELSVKIFTAKKSIAKKCGSNSDDYEPLEFVPDDEVQEFSMPYFTLSSQNKYNCFGAPQAMAKGECIFVNDTITEITNWKNKSEPPKELIVEATKHFSKHDRARSVVSIPLLTSRYAEEHKLKAMGVVNIYRDKTNLMMGDESKQSQFEHVTTPLNIALARIVSQDIVARYYANFLITILDSANLTAPELGVDYTENNQWWNWRNLWVNFCTMRNKFFKTLPHKNP